MGGPEWEAQRQHGVGGGGQPDHAPRGEAILNTKCFEPIRLSKFGSLYFIDGGGNHRVCQAKFLGLETVPCEVTE